jgi:hypothetical protein
MDRFPRCLGSHSTETSTGSGFQLPGVGPVQSASRKMTWTERGSDASIQHLVANSLADGPDVSLVLGSGQYRLAPPSWSGPSAPSRAIAGLLHAFADGEGVAILNSCGRWSKPPSPRRFRSSVAGGHDPGGGRRSRRKSRTAQAVEVPGHADIGARIALRRPDQLEHAGGQQPGAPCATTLRSPLPSARRLLAPPCRSAGPGARRCTTRRRSCSGDGRSPRRSLLMLRP